MNKQELETATEQLVEIFDKLYALDTRGMNSHQRLAYHEIRSKAFLAMTRAENASLRAINAHARAASVPGLLASIASTKESLDGITKVTDILRLVDAGIRAITSFAAILKP